MKRLICVVLLTAGLSACEDSGTEYLGKWVHVKSECSTLEVVKNGSDFLLNIDSPGFFGREKLSVSASLKDGKLLVASQLPQTGVINKNTGNLLIASDEYRHRTEKDKDCFAGKK